MSLNRFASFSIPSLQGLSNGATFWLDRRGNTSSNNALVPDFYDLASCQVVKIYIATQAQTSAVGLTLALTELWPGGPGIALPPSVVNGGIVNVDSFAIPATAFNAVWNVDPYQSFVNGSGFKSTIYRGGLMAFQISATTWPSVSVPFFIDVWGIKDATFPRH